MRTDACRKNVTCQYRLAPTGHTNSQLLFRRGVGVFQFTAVLFGMHLGGFPGVMGGMQPMSVSDVRVVCSRLVVSFFVVVGGLAVVGRRVLVVFGRFAVVLGDFVSIHVKILLLNSRREASQLDEVRKTVG